MSETLITQMQYNNDEIIRIIKDESNQYRGEINQMPVVTITQEDKQASDYPHSLMKDGNQDLYYSTVTPINDF